MPFRPAIPALWLVTAAAGCSNPSAEASVGDNGGGGQKTSGIHRTGSSSGSSGGGSGSTLADGGAGAGSVTGSSSGGSSGATTTIAMDGGSSSSSGGSSAAAALCGSNLPADAGSQIHSDFTCYYIPYYDGGAGGCPGDWLATTLVDFESCMPVCGAAVQALTPDGVPIAGTEVYSDPVSGTFHFCLPSPQLYETQVTAPGYPPFYWGEIDGQAEADLPLFGMLSTEELLGVTPFLQASVGPDEGELLAFLFPHTPCGTTDVKQGWTMWLTDEDGGLYPDGGYAVLYINESGFPDPSLTATSEEGSVLFYGIDPAVATLPSVHAAPPDGGACQVDTSLGFTGRFLTGAGIFSELGLYLMPAN